MKMSRDSQRHYTVDDYFTVEERSEVKHEFYNGEIFAMAGASLPHNEITANLLTELRVGLRNLDCGVYGSDLRIQTPSGLYTYPDLSVICNGVELAPGRSDTVTNPVVLIEVLSEATEDYDRGEKFELYKSIPTLRHYILVSQSEIHIDHFHRIDPVEWQCRSMKAPNDTLEIDLPHTALAITAVYRRVF